LVEISNGRCAVHSFNGEGNKATNSEAAKPTRRAQKQQQGTKGHDTHARPPLPRRRRPPGATGDGSASCVGVSEEEDVLAVYNPAK
jgi:hypothetical protein